MKNTAVIASGLSETAKGKLKVKGISVLDFGKNTAVGEYVSHHADLSFLFDGADTLFVADEMKIHVDSLCKYVKNIIVIPEHAGSKYPDDVLLNCVPVGKDLICNIDTVSKTVLKYFTQKNYRIINVKQGYTKCSVVPVSETAIITDDESVAAECTKNGYDVLFVKKGSVKLSGFEYGFIGGAAGKISAKEIVFNGNINLHSDAVLIKNFLSKYGIFASSLTDGYIEDIGSIIPLYTEV